MTRAVCPCLFSDRLPQTLGNKSSSLSSRYTDCRTLAFTRQVLQDLAFIFGILAPYVLELSNSTINQTKLETCFILNFKMTVISVTAHHIFSLPSASCFVFVCLKANMPQNYKNQPHIADMETILSLPVDLGTTCGHVVFLPISDSFISSSFPAVMSPVSLSLSHRGTNFKLPFFSRSHSLHDCLSRALTT